MQLRPTGSYVTIRPELPEEKTGGGIFLPASAHDSSSFVARVEKLVYDRGTILATGRGHINKRGVSEPHEAVAGDFVLFEKTAAVQGASYTDDTGQLVLVMHAAHILAVVER